MKAVKTIKYYSPVEEKLNLISHVFGLVLGLFALVLLVTKASLHGNVWHVVGVSIFGASLIMLYAASTCYHSVEKPELRKRLRIFDHASIYILIAGTYTPFTLVTLRGFTGWIIFGIVWGLALIGIILKLFFTGKFSLLSTIMYVFMGWVMVFALKPLIHQLPLHGLFWLVAGGVAYTVCVTLCRYIFMCYHKKEPIQVLFICWIPAQNIPG